MKVTVLGAGTMGHGIALVAARAGCETTLYDIEDQFVADGLRKIAAFLDKGIERGKVTAEQKNQALAQLSGSADLELAAADADLVIEAVPEKIELKQQIFRNLSRICRPETILATNTSSLPVSRIAEAAEHPERVIGLHFFNPPPILKLLEIVFGEQTSEQTLATAREIGERFDKQVVVVQDSPGFASSRLGIALGMEAIRMVESGVATAEDIDRAMVLGYGHPMGPLKLTDLVGLDVRLNIAEYLHRELGSETFRPPELLRQLVAEGKLGKKSGQGFYNW